MRFSRTDHIVLLGGARATVELAAALRRLPDYSLDVITAPRQEHDPVTRDGKRFGESLAELGIPYRVAEDINSDADFLNSITGQTLALGIGEAWSFSPQVIERLDGRLIDLMGIPLPRYRGGAHYTWQILRGSRRGACNLQIVNDEMRPGLFDSGPVIKRWEYFFPATARTPADYFDYASSKETAFMLDFLDELAAGKNFETIPVQETFALYFPRLATTEQAFIDWQWPTRDIETMICAFDTPYPGAATSLNGSLVRVANAWGDIASGPFHPFQCGLIYRTDGSHAHVATRDGTVVLGAVRDSDGNSVMGSLRVGDRFVTPTAWIERGLSHRPDY